MPDVSPTTRKTYATSWAAFAAWCAAREITPLPVDLAAAAAWLNARARAGRSRPSLLVDRAALAARQRAAGYPWQPDERLTRAIARGRARGRPRPPGAAALRTAAAACGEGLGASRDRALLLLAAEGFPAAMLAALDLEHLQWERQWLVIRSQAAGKQQPEHRTLHRRPGEAGCPVAALELWIHRAGLRWGALFPAVTRYGQLEHRMSATAVRLVLRRARAFEPVVG
jgi:integrase